MPNFTSNPVASGQAWNVSSAEPVARLGARIDSTDGRKFRYVQAGSANLVPGNLLQSPAPIADHVNLTIANAAIGDSSVTVSLGATAVAAGDYQDGLLVFSTAPGTGYAYGIASHPAADLSTDVVLKLKTADTLQTIANSTSKVDLVANPYKGVVADPTSQTSAPAGVAIYPILAGEYGWIQTGGDASVLIEGTPAAGVAVSPSANVAGAVAVAELTGQAANTATTSAIVGYIRQTGVDGKHKVVSLILDK